DHQITRNRRAAMTRIAIRQNYADRAKADQDCVTVCSAGQQELRRTADEERYEFILAGIQWTGEATRRLVQTWRRRLIATSPSHIARWIETGGV
ncbi:MAG: hypothetical protein O7A03_08975, partial [Alphaproteobacteria bacterium]|nr:hypothetical protein [Alphaproteobacteria bacterium]